MMNCRDAHKLVIRSQDEGLSLAERLGLRFHLFICTACAAFERQMDFLRAACRSFPGDGD
ncbi:MAG TPA: zf-HC2 domain-containing protein [Rhodocyclaceae bacterium]|nr:zf-HC2 domain-containing protein [Rhodocyclaceae bacterium]